MRNILLEKSYAKCYILLPDQISMSGSLYFVRYWAKCILQLFVNQVVTSKVLKLAFHFWSSHFFYMTKMSRQKFDEFKTNFFIIFKGLLLNQIEENFFGRWESDFNWRQYVANNSKFFFIHALRKIICKWISLYNFLWKKIFTAKKKLNEL